MPDLNKDPDTLATVLCVSGHDPSGGAGLQADIETVSACGGYAFSVPSCLTIQSHLSVTAVKPVELTTFKETLEHLLSTVTPAAIKVGLLGHAEQASALGNWIESADMNIPLVVDPVIRASSGSALSDTDTLNAIREELLPLTTLLTPNHAEARQLADAPDMDTSIKLLLATGCQHILLTGGDEKGPDVHNCLYDSSGLAAEWHQHRLEGPFHGSGCTLASAAATFLALGRDTRDACTLAQAFTQRALEKAINLGEGPLLPWRSSL